MSLKWPIWMGYKLLNGGEGCLENPCVGGSIPPQATSRKPKPALGKRQP